MSARWFTFFVWAAVAATGVFWTLKLLVKPAPTPVQAQVADQGVVAAGDFTRLLGTDPAPAVVAAEPAPAADARFNLIGVVSPRGAQPVREGVALIAVDGKPARAYRVGAVVDGQTVLQTVQARGVELGPRDGPAQIALKLQPPAPAAVGTLPAAGGAMPAPAPPPRPFVNSAPPTVLPTAPSSIQQSMPMTQQLQQMQQPPVAVPPGVAPPTQPATNQVPNRSELK